MRAVVVVGMGLIGLTGCHGSVLMDASGGYQYAPFAKEYHHGVTFAANFGYGDMDTGGFGGSLRLRGLENGLVQEWGVHGYLLSEDDTQVAFFFRGMALLGLGEYGDRFVLTINPVLNPGILLYPNDDSPVFVSIGATVECPLSPWRPFAEPAAGLHIGVGIGGSN